MIYFDWIKNRWFDLRNGQIYIQFVISFIQFVIITYSLTRIQFVINEVEYGLLLLVGLTLVSTSIGFYYHRKKQLETDQNSAFKRSTLSARVNRITLQAILGEFNEDEVTWAIQLLMNIEKGNA